MGIGGRFAVVSLFSASLLVSRPGSACKVASNSPLEVNETGVGAAPGPVGEVTVSVKRGRGSQGSGCGRESATSCDDIGQVLLYVTPATDADSSPDAIGYRLRLATGRLPGDLALPREPVTTYTYEGAGGDLISLSWIDGASDDQEGISFTLTLTPIDADGNVGPESPPIVVRHEGDDSGCAVAQAPGSRRPLAPLVSTVLAALALVRRHLGQARRAGPFPSSRLKSAYGDG